ncbi:mechanosensitive ion channel family protein [Extensimonas vulgaris]|uniref:Small-conductance mechanosensitive channel n=1 Tax=Extensimonas vulgaris TaxID=1031594 RepID=A0A369AM27_9BURK|nr:mechanosensitive ion channel family protein [Extensimonas vulgaris]RCX09217.1 small-conductance mechanosensitive channel [Extensimonas vulgaris]TWI37800.1 small-conductance mechanosensitive channel [Extensimonas vulgaris]TXD15887.1 mechanosensitive ion channel family protein [Extensimonas vulgaris]
MPDWIPQNWRDYSLWGWLAPVLSVLLAVAATRLLRPRLVRRLRSLAERTPTPIDEALVYGLEATRPWLVGAMVLGPATAHLPLGAPWSRVVEVITVVGVFVQIGLWAARLIDFWIRRSRQRALKNDPGTATGFAVTSFIARVTLWAIVLLVMLDNLGINVTALVAGLGVGGIAVGFALQNILGDLFSSLSIVMDKPFQIGHFIDVDGYVGTVEYIGLKTTRVRALSGELLIFSNTDLTKARLRNYQVMQERRIVFGFGVTYDTPPEALALIPGLVREIIEAQPQTRFDRAHFKAFGAASLDFEVVYWMLTPDYTTYMNTQHAINLRLLRELNDRGIAFAFPTQTVHLQAVRPVRVRMEPPPSDS